MGREEFTNRTILVCAALSAGVSGMPSIDRSAKPLTPPAHQRPNQHQPDREREVFESSFYTYKRQTVVWVNHHHYHHQHGALVKRVTHRNAGHNGKYYVSSVVPCRWCCCIACLTIMDIKLWERRTLEAIYHLQLLSKSKVHKEFTSTSTSSSTITITGILNSSQVTAKGPLRLFGFSMRARFPPSNRMIVTPKRS